MRILILGGTSFVGRAIAESLLHDGHDVTVFHRGLSDKSALINATHILGDRENSPNFGSIQYDIVVDSSAYEVKPVRLSCAALRDAGRYIFISTISVYRDLSRMDEDAPVRDAEGADDMTLSLSTYGSLKVACENVVRETFGERAWIVRPGLILGPRDYDDRFAYWLRRIAKGGEVLAPGNPEANVQFIDARDLADFIALNTTRATGTFNVNGEPTSIQSFFERIRDVTKSDATFTWVPDELLLKNQVAPFSEMPFWMPASLCAQPVDTKRARAKGLRSRPVLETIRDTYVWLLEGWASATAARAHRKLPIPAGISAERESKILGEYRGD